MDGIKYDDILGEWYIELPSGATLACDRKSELELVLDAIERREIDRTENRIEATCMAALLFGIFAIVGVTAWGTVCMFWK